MRYRENDKVYFYRCDTMWSAFVEEDCKDHYRVRLNHGGSTNCLPEELFKTEADCMKNQEKKSKELENHFYNSLHSLEDLVKFSLSHSVYGEHCEPEARNAVIRKAGDFGISVS